jgi:predicted exporter
MSNRVVAWILGVVVRNPRRATLVGLAVMALSLAAASRIRIADDARALVAEGDPVVARQLLALSEFTTVDSLLLHLEAEGHADELLPAARSLVDTLVASGRFSDARYEPEPATQLDLVKALMPRRFVLDPRAPADLMAPAALDRALAETREALLAPQGIVSKPFLLGDPLGSMKAALQGLGSAPGLSKLDVSSGRFLSQDGQSLLIVAHAKGNPFAADDAALTMEVVDEATRKLAPIAPHVIVRPIGSHRFATDAARMVKHDIHVNTLTTALAIIAIFLIFFRKPRLILVAFPPLLFGTSLAAGAVGLVGRPVHGIVLAFAGACLGLAVDYTIYLMTTAAAVGGPPREALPEAGRRIGRALNLAMATTMAGLLALLVSRIPALRQMGLVALAAVFGSYLGALLWVPIVLPLLAPRAPASTTMPGPWTWALRQAVTRPRLVLVLAVAIAAVLGGFGFRTELDGELRHLDTHTDQGAADLAAFTRSFGDAATAGLTLIEAPSLDIALERAREAEKALSRAGIERVLSVTAVAPPRSVAVARRDAWCSGREGWVTTLHEAAVRNGFKAGAFGTFEGDLAALCGTHGDGLLSAEPALAAFAAILGRPAFRVENGVVRLAVPFEADDARFDTARAAVADVPGAAIAHRRALNARLVELVGEDLPRVGFLSLGLVALLMLASFRSVRKTLFALAPCLLAVATFLGLYALTKTPLNIMNLTVFALLNGSGVDYGILMVDTDPDEGIKGLNDRAFGVVVASLTSLAGFGSLATARYFAIATIGHAVLVAVGTAALYALVVTPALVTWSRRGRPILPASAAPLERAG